MRTCDGWEENGEEAKEEIRSVTHVGRVLFRLLVVEEAEEGEGLV